MKPKMILFDLDGTLLPMDQDVFVKAYFGALAKKLADHGYEPQKLVQSIWTGTKAMIKNDGSKKNEQAFWDTFAGIYGEQVRDEIVYFDEFYAQNFDGVQASCGFNAQAEKTVRALKEAGYRLALATNPIFPSVATEKRMLWAGLDKADFELYTTYENSRYCKPNLKYYEDILTALGVRAEECLMVGNDVGEDMVVANMGMKVFLLTDCLINRDGKDVSVYPHGDFSDLLAFVEIL
ncbi:MAG: HAD family hydrolase [Clostridia bacterium]|nr:HAD family hydrolase [Clostridia bacterium]